ncbi:MAG: DNA topoisomerase [Mediterraneibacter gnavus]
MQGRTSIPKVEVDHKFYNVSAAKTEHFTAPPKPYSEDTLLAAMETAGNKEFEEDTEKKGLGTPATRAGIIEKLIASQYAVRKGKQILPTEDGISIDRYLTGFLEICHHDSRMGKPTVRDGAGKDGSWDSL